MSKEYDSEANSCPLTWPLPRFHLRKLGTRMLDKEKISHMRSMAQGSQNRQWRKQGRDNRARGDVVICNDSRAVMSSGKQMARSTLKPRGLAMVGDAEV